MTRVRAPGPGVGTWNRARPDRTAIGTGRPDCQSSVPPARGPDLNVASPATTPSARIKPISPTRTRPAGGRRAVVRVIRGTQRGGAGPIRHPTPGPFPTGAGVRISIGPARRPA